MTGTTKAPPSPMGGPNQPVDWLFVYKFNAASFPGYDDVKDPPAGVSGRFGGKTQDYSSGMSQNYVFATSSSPKLVRGKGRLGDSNTDPLSETFAQIYDNNDCYYICWNDQFYEDPLPTKEAPHGHSKGIAAWNEDGEGFVLQVSTPSWPASGSRKQSRNNPKSGKQDANTLGCVLDDDIKVGQHFFCLSLKGDDLEKVLTALENASVVTDPAIPALCRNGGPENVQKLVKGLGGISKSKKVYKAKLSSGVQLISKPSHLHVPPWQLVSAQLKGLDLRVISWWAYPKIDSTKAGKVPACWDKSLGIPGAVEIATTGSWDGVEIGLEGGPGKNSNHAKIGVAMSKDISIFGDENQQGALCEYTYTSHDEDKDKDKDKNKEKKKDKPKETVHHEYCKSSQNGRGGTFYAMEQAELHQSLQALFKGESAPLDTHCK